jgi:HPt (histidine-containing phosphotransfer) domain-containing protein
MQDLPPSDSNPLEQAMMERIRQLGLVADPGFVIELIDSYSPMFERLRSSILDAFQKQDRNKLHYAAHSLKGASLNIGATELADIARNIEGYSESAEFGTMEPYIRNLDVHLKQANDAMLSIKAKLSKQQTST